MALRLPCLVAVPTLLLFAVVGCGTAPHDEDVPELGTQSSEIRIANALTTKALVLNAIATNRESNELLGTSALLQLFDPVFGDERTRMRLHDENAQKFMEYLVGCALTPSQSVEYFNPRMPNPGVRKWWGQAGLCPSWAWSIPSESCLERVSACLLARNNKEGRRVELSIRGEHRFTASGPNIYTLEAKTRPADHVPVTGVPVASFGPCGMGESGAQRNCGWTADGIGTCTPSTPVWVGAGGPMSCGSPSSTLGSSVNGPAALRVCEGVAGCDHFDARNLSEAAGVCLGSFGTPVATFTCPVGGYFSVMTAPVSSTSTGLVATVGTFAEYPTAYGLSEQQVYGVREGAFYGNIFLPDELAAEVDVEERVVNDRKVYEVVGADVIVDGSIYKQMFSCYDPGWSEGAAYSAGRVCALPSMIANCASTVTGPCFPTPALAGKCAIQDGPLTPGDGDYELCTDTAEKLWTQTVTTFLHTPCDTVTRAERSKICGRAVSGNPVPTQPLPWPPRKKDLLP
ncbi:putative lipoprotein [Myxococcus hansupus]|uniref:Putative lipoprotein n=1 Tax=Pseudomyxococcus hansupus TaxID=1297742 RepID=A0A0H4XFP4_9BACT|nr:hypothetical protein [Myxococcus hansupus]AKQ67007.1 putative lipoprotein [Myxococcus hansupus]